MDGYDDLFQQGQGQGQGTFRNDLPFDKEAWKQQKQEQRDAVYAMIDEMAEAVTRDGGVFRNYLDIQSRFNRYSVSNALLILSQRPDATRIADFDTWKEQGVYIRKNETGFYILEPGDEYQREDGSTGVSYNPKRMFDILQTGVIRKHETPSFPDDRTRIKALVDHAPVPIHVNDTLPEGVNAIYRPDTREIQIRHGMDADSIFRSLSQGLAHAEMDGGDGEYDCNGHGFHAYYASYMLCKQFGVETDGHYYFDHSPEALSGMEPQEVRAELSKIREAVNEISGRMNRMLNQQRQQKRQEPER